MEVGARAELFATCGGVEMEVVEDLCAPDLGEVHLLAVAVSAIQDKCSASDPACCRICMYVSGSLQ